MTLEGNYFPGHVGIPDENFKVKPTTDDDFMCFTVGYLPHSSLVSLEHSDGACGYFVIQDISVEFDVSEVLFDFVLFSLGFALVYV